TPFVLPALEPVVPAQPCPKPSPLLFREARRKMALAGLWPSPRVVFTTGWLLDDELTPELPARIGDLFPACPAGALSVPRQDRP
uniref:hypothetical protein n=1 Tax=unclassified Kineococcus TaxID=2621656 RepID=UPI003D7C5DC7